MATLPSVKSIFSGLGSGMPSLVPTANSTAPTIAKPVMPVINAQTMKPAPNLTPTQLGSIASPYSVPVPKAPVPSTLPTSAMMTPKISSQSGPVIPQVSSPIKTTPSGMSVNASTGGVVTPTVTPPPVNTYAPVIPSTYPTATNNNNVVDTSTPAATDTPAMPITASTDPLNSPLYTSPAYEAALKQYQSFSTPTQPEVQAQQDITNLQNSLRTAFTNTEGQAIPLEFITGQERNLQAAAANKETALTGNLGNLQSNRKAAQDAASTVLNSEAAKLAGYRTMNTPTSVAFGSSLVNPASGTTVFGTSGSMDAIGTAIADGRLTPDMVTRYGAASIANALQKDPGYNFVTQKASIASDSSSLTENQKYADTTSRAYETATANLNTLLGFMSTNGINQSDVPIINQITNKAKAGGLDPGSVAAFNASLEGLRSEYAQVLSRGGQVSDTSRANAEKLIPSDISPAQLQVVLGQLSKEGTNAIKEANQKVTDIKTRIGKGGSSTSDLSSVTMGNTQFYQDPKTGKWTYK